MESATAMPLTLRGVAATPPKPCILQAALRRNRHLLLGTKNASRPRHLSCKATGGRRDVLLGLGGAAAAASLPTSSRYGSALATPIELPDIRKCHHPRDLPKIPDVNCCPPYRAVTEIVDFKPPPASSPLRVRPAAHLVDKECLAKYEKAVELMKALPDDDPRSFAQQWRVHCAYCDGAYDQVGLPELEIEIHQCWLFLPWHRLYLYFHERILGKLIGDDRFALPFWNWDAPDGMTLPAIYASGCSPLYDKRRNPAHQPPFTVDLDYSGTDPKPPTPRDQQIDKNLKTMYCQMVSGAKTKELFFGQPYYRGCQPSPGQGTIESKPHNTVHNWTGTTQPNYEDMGNFYSAARDPVFFAHHGNIDRLWCVWNELHHDNKFTDPNWLDASFLFYDEEARLVRARVRDCLDPTALRYKYQHVKNKWLDPPKRSTKVAKPSTEAGSPAPTTGVLPATLSQTVRVAVTRPRTRKEKDDEEEVLVVEGIEVADPSRYVKFDVFVNETPSRAVQCPGSVALTPHGVRRKGSVKTAARFGIGDLLDDIGADQDSKIVVSLVPRSAGDTVTVHDVRIEYVK